MINVYHGHRIESLATGEHVLYVIGNDEPVDTFAHLSAAQHCAKVRSLVQEYLDLEGRQEQPDYGPIRKILAAAVRMVPASDDVELLEPGPEAV